MQKEAQIGGVGAVEEPAERAPHAGQQQEKGGKQADLGAAGEVGRIEAVLVAAPASLWLHGRNYSTGDFHRYGFQGQELTQLSSAGHRKPPPAVLQ
jgi:hypothetical protein